MLSDVCDLYLQIIRCGNSNVVKKAGALVEVATHWKAIVVHLAEGSAGAEEGTATHVGMEGEFLNDRLLRVQFVVCGHLLCEYILVFF